MSPVSRRRLQLAGRLLFGSLWRRRERAAIALAAIALGSSVATALVLVARDVERMVSRELAAYGANVAVTPRAEEAEAGLSRIRLATLTSRSDFESPGPEWSRPASTDGGAVRVETALPLLYGTARAVPNPMRWETALVAGTDIHALRRLHPGWQMAMAMLPDEGKPFVWMGADVARRLGVAVGDTLSLLPLARGGDHLAVCVGVTFESGGSEDEVIYLPLEEAERLLGTRDRLSVILARVTGTPADIEQAIASGWLSGSDREARVLRRMSAAEGELLERLRILFGAVTLFALAAAALCATSTLTDLALERRREVALLKSLGASRREVVGLFLAEAAILGLAGGALGFGLGALTAQAVGRSVFGSSIRVDFGMVPGLLTLALLVTVVAGLPPVRYALAVEPARALRGE